MNKVVRLNKYELKHVIAECVKRCLNESVIEEYLPEDDFYSEEDEFGETSDEAGRIRQYDLEGTFLDGPNEVLYLDDVKRVSEKYNLSVEKALVTIFNEDIDADDEENCYTFGFCWIDKIQPGGKKIYQWPSEDYDNCVIACYDYGKDGIVFYMFKQKTQNKSKTIKPLTKTNIPPKANNPIQPKLPKEWTSKNEYNPQLYNYTTNVSESKKKVNIG